MKRMIYTLVWLLAGLAYLAPAALAVDPPQHALALANTQVWVIAVGCLVPLVTYVLNHNAPWVSEPVKATVLVIAAAIAGGVTQAINAGSVGFNESTFQLVLSSIVAALVAHHLLWKPSGIAAKLGGGTDALSRHR